MKRASPYVRPSIGPLYPPKAVLPSSNHMKTSTASAVLPCNARNFLGRLLGRVVSQGALRIEELEKAGLLLSSRSSREISRKLRIVPKMKLPAPVAKLIGESFAYEDHGTLNRARNEWTWRMEQPIEPRPQEQTAQRRRRDARAQSASKRPVTDRRRRTGFLHRSESMFGLDEASAHRVEHRERAAERPRQGVRISQTVGRHQAGRLTGSGIRSALERLFDVDERQLVEAPECASIK